MGSAADRLAVSSPSSVSFYSYIFFIPLCWALRFAGLFLSVCHASFMLLLFGPLLFIADFRLFISSPSFLDLLFILTFVLSAAVCVLSHSFLTWISLYCSEWYADGIFFFIYAQDPFVCSVVCPLWFRGLCRCCWCLVEARLSIPNCTGPHVCLYYFVVPVLSYDFPFPSLAMTIFPFWR